MDLKGRILLFAFMIMSLSKVCYANDVDIDGITYEIFTSPINCARVKSCNSKKDFVTIRPVVQYKKINYPVLGINANAFIPCDNIKHIIVFSNLRAEAMGLFSVMRNLQSIYQYENDAKEGYKATLYRMPKSGNNVEVLSSFKLDKVDIPITEISAEAFKDNQSIEVVTLPSNIRNIEDGAFANCGNLKTINLPETLIYIGKEAFERDANLDNVEIPSTVLTLGASAFRGCSGMNHITIPSNLEMIRAETFKDCINLQSISFTDPTGRSLYYIDASAFENCSKLLSFDFKGIQHIGNRAFYNAKLRSQSLDMTTVLTIGEMCFGGTSIKDITFSNAIARIGQGAFSECSMLTSLTMPDDSPLTEIPDNLCYNCTNLENVILSQFITNIGKGSFFGCNLKEISLPQNLITLGDCAFAKNMHLQKISIPESVRQLGGAIFAEDQSLMLVDNKSEIGNIPPYAFYKCSSLYNVNIPFTVANIGQSAFEDCQLLPGVAIPPGVSSIEAKAFKNCTNLSQLFFSPSLKTIGDNAFENCPQIKNVDLSMSQVESIGEFTFYKCSGLNVLKVPSSLSSMGAAAFANCKDLQVVEIPPQCPITQLSDSIFKRCPTITTISLPATVTLIGNSAFAHCKFLKNLLIPSNSQLNEIGESAFESCEYLSEFSPKNKLRQIGDRAFKNCVKLAKVELPYGLQNLGIETFANCGNITSLNLPESISSIGDGCFMATGLTEFNFPMLTLAINKDVLKDCKSLESVNIPCKQREQDCTSIYAGAFRGCVNLKKIFLPTAISGGDSDNMSDAFVGCDNLEVIRLYGPQPMGTQPFFFAPFLSSKDVVINPYEKWILEIDPAWNLTTLVKPWSFFINKRPIYTPKSSMRNVDYSDSNFYSVSASNQDCNEQTDKIMIDYNGKQILKKIK